MIFLRLFALMSTYIMNITAHEVPQTMRLENSEKEMSYFGF